MDVPVVQCLVSFSRNSVALFVLAVGSILASKVISL